MEKFCKTGLVTGCVLLLAAVALSGVRTGSRLRLQRDRAAGAVHAQMFLKGGIDEEGFSPCYAEGKRYGIKAVQEQTFRQGEDSFHKMHHHGVALENDEMAYRIYFDKRHTVDVYAKKTPRIELPVSLWYPNDSLLAEGYGDDVLLAGNTIGAGSVRLYDRRKGKLIPFDRFEQRTQRIVRLSKDSAVAEMEVTGIPCGNLTDSTASETASYKIRYTVTAGRRDMLCEVFCSGLQGELVTGVQQIGNGPTAHSHEAGNLLLTAWGTAWPVNDTIKYAKETTGIAVCVPEQYAGQPFSDPLQLLVPLLTDSNGYCRFRLTCVAQKENNPPARTWEDFRQWIARWSENAFTEH